METLAIAIIESMPASLHRLTVDLTPEQLRAKPAPGEWCVLEIVGHLIDKTESWGNRMRRIAAEDKPVLPAYDQDAYVRERGYATAEAGTLVARIRELSAALGADLRALPPAAWERQGIHEERGIMTLGEACRVYAISIPEHIGQLVAASTAATQAEHLPGRPG